jgi:hypothetical protein
MEELGVEPRAAPEVAVFLRALITVLQKCLWNAIHSVPAGFYTIVFISKHARNRFGQKKDIYHERTKSKGLQFAVLSPFFSISLDKRPVVFIGYIFLMVTNADLCYDKLKDWIAVCIMKKLIQSAIILTWVAAVVFSRYRSTICYSSLKLHNIKIHSLDAS